MKVMVFHHMVDKVFLRVHVPRSTSFQATTGAATFPCQLTALSLEKMTSFLWIQC